MRPSATNHSPGLSKFLSREPLLPTTERDITYEVIYADGRSLVRGLDRPAFTLVLRDDRQYEWVRRADLYSAAIGYIRGDFGIRGDLISAILFKRAANPLGFRDVISWILAGCSLSRIESWFQTRSRAAQNIRFHYDLSNDFYRLFLDSRMVYSCAYFKDQNQTLDEAQLAKLDHICRKLDLRPEEQVLDIGCGWGGLMIRAAEQFGAIATGCTLSLQQDLFAAKAILDRRLEHRVNIQRCDYRKMEGRFNKIASVGMFEHVGRRRLGEYFRKIHTLLEDNGLFLNHGIIRPEGTADGPETLLLQRRVFPGGELVPLSSVIREAGTAGFEVLDVENLRPHYALTCRHWVERLRRNASECLRHVDGQTYRTWLLYLAGSALSFEMGHSDLYQVLMAKRGVFQHRRLTRNYMYA